ncbi:MAG: SH3 domain-containing protein [Anaerolineaceae bacterium]|nr:SH3 domain-containing protein [Anaerolineaceae bacterium]
MRHNKVFFLSILLSICLSACQSGGEGPRSWIDQPLDNTIFPLQTIILQAHASDSDGVDFIEFYLEDETLIEAAAGGGRMGEAIYSWLPPGAGVYTIYARSTDNQGNQGSAAASKIFIFDEVIQVPSEDQAPIMPELASDDEEEEEIQVAVPEEPSSGPMVTADRNINCRNFPDTSSEIKDVLESDQPAAVIGRLANNTWYQVLHPKSQIACWVSGSLVDPSGDFSQVPVKQPQQSPAEPQAPPEPAVPAPAADTTAPAIFGAGTDKQTMCASATVTSNVVVYDEGGVNKVYATWRITDSNGNVAESGNVNYTRITSIENAYTGVFGTFTYTGTLSINGTVVDNAGNSVSFSHTVTIDCS